VPAVPTEECPSLPANYAIPPYEPQILRLAQAAQPRVHPTVHFSDDQWRHYRHAYFRLCEQVDAQIGAILAAVQETGLARDTVIIFTSDHGDGLGAHRWNQKWALYEEPTRIPLIVSWPGGAPPGQVDHTHLISNGLDLVPTICDYAGIAPPTGLLGRSVRPLVEGGAAPAWPDQVVAETAWDKTVLPRSAGRMLRTARHKYVAYSWGQHREQLFDLTEDPGELVNLAVDAHYRSLLREHRERLAHWCEQTDDTFRVPE
jgi:arylsulfatase A-like enzyme